MYMYDPNPFPLLSTSSLGIIFLVLHRLMLYKMDKSLHEWKYVFNRLCTVKHTVFSNLCEIKFINL